MGHPCVTAISTPCHVNILSLPRNILMNPIPATRSIRTLEFFLPSSDLVLRRPMLIFEVQDDVWVGRADRMHQRYDDMPSKSPPSLVGSLLGTSLRIYCTGFSTSVIDPAFEDRPSSDNALPSNFLEGAWNVKLLSQEGFDKIKEIVGDIQRLREVFVILQQLAELRARAIYYTIRCSRFFRVQ